MMEIGYWMPVMLGGLVAGESTGLLGVFIVGMRIPFLGICVSHAALAGAVFGSLVGLTGPMLLVPALIGAVLTALLLGLLDPEQMQTDTNVILGVLFSLTMGLAFLGIGLFSILGKSDNEVRNLLWGSLMFCRWKDLTFMLIVLGTTVGFVGLFYKEMRALMFSRLHATAAGIPVTLVWTTFLILTSLTLTVNFQTVGGLMIYSLMVNPATAAFQLVKGYRRVLLLSFILGGFSGLGGFLISAATDLPTGATIVLLSSSLVGTAAGIRWLKRRPKGIDQNPL
jgi:manganese/iron transport system permease protein